MGFNDVMHKFNAGIYGRKQVLDMVVCGTITFDEYRKITDKNYKEPRKSRKMVEETTSTPAPHRVDRTTSIIGEGPRGDYYDWCELLENGTLRFGSEQGNYAGGTTTAYYFSNYYPGAGEHVYDDFVPDKYWHDVIHILKRIKEHDGAYYKNIVDMCKKNKSGTALALIEKIEKGDL